MADWGFYGRKTELGELERIFSRGRWFFLKVAGRRRIGKTSLVQRALSPTQSDCVLYVQIPDSDPAGVVSAARDFFEMFGITEHLPHDLRSLATSVGALVEKGWIVALDEFQYFNRKHLFDFTSQLQAEVDRLAAHAEQVRGGLIVLGSLQTEMSALLEDRSAPLYNRATDTIDLGHLDIESVLEILRTHADDDPMRLLFLWNLFEGVPKFFRDCFERGVLAGTRREVLEQMFFSSSSPLRGEADNWFLHELRGRYDLVLKYIATHPGCSNADLEAHAQSVDPKSKAQVGGYLKILDEKFSMIERLQPVFAKPAAKKGRFYIRDNFLRAWLAALAIPVASISFRPLQALLEQADTRLAQCEGHGLERLVAVLYEERSRKSLGDFNLTHRVKGWWDRVDTEIDLVAVDDDSEIVRLCTCKRSSDKLLSDASNFEGHVARFLRAFPKFSSWTVEKVGVAPRLTDDERAVLQARGIRGQDLTDLVQGL